MILGEWDARQNPDCINGLCADPIVTIKIETMFTSYFNTKRKLHDILLIILERAVIFSGNDPMELTEEMEKSIGLCLFMQHCQYIYSFRIYFTNLLAHGIAEFWWNGWSWYVLYVIVFSQFLGHHFNNFLCV